MNIRNARLYVLYGLIIVILAGFVFRLMRYQITDGASFRTQSEKTTIQSTEIAAPRGEVLDRYGRVLATNTVGYSVTLQKAAWPSANQNQNILKITDILAQDGETWLDTLPIGQAEPWAFTANSDAQIKTLRKFLEQTVDNIPTSTKLNKVTLNEKQKAKFDADEKATAPEIMARLIKRYKIAGNYTPAQIRTIVGVRYQMESAGFSYTYTYTFAKNVSLNTVNRLSENGGNIPGVLITQQYTRSYTSDTFAPFIIGTVSPISSDQWNNTQDPSASLKNKGYSMDDMIGSGGVESKMEQYLRGTNGTQNVLINKAKEIVGTETATAAKPGDNVVLTIDANLQQIVQDELPVVINQVRAASGGSTLNGADADAGAAVVLNVKTGEILAMASYPTYTRTQYTQNYAALSQDSSHPLLNRTIQGTYRPGSTYKPVTAIAGLMSGVITPTETVYTQTWWTKYGAHFYDDTTNSSKNVVTALAASSNYFFYTVADRLYMSGQLAKLESAAKALGLGQKSGVELPGELSGEISGPADTKARGGIWYPADAAQSGIGQLNNLYTPLQMAQYVGAIANGGTYYKAHIVKSVKSYDNLQTVVDNQPQLVNSDFKITDSVIQIVKQGMLRVTEGNDGTASSVFQNFPVKLGGKTGTAQTNNRQNYNGVFISFAPFDNPEIAVAVVVEKGHNGFQTAPVARSAYNYYFVGDQQFTTDALPSVSSPLPAAAGSLLP
ncbi:MAG: penicillin-binding transpeptidase domain-containing protein [Ethanoligenens sp.]